MSEACRWEKGLPSALNVLNTETVSRKNHSQSTEETFRDENLIGRQSLGGPSHSGSCEKENTLQKAGSLQHPPSTQGENRREKPS